MVDETEMVDDPETEGLIFSTKTRKIITKLNYFNNNKKITFSLRKPQNKFLH